MRRARLVATILVVAATLQPLLGQATKPPMNSTDSDKAMQLERARAALFDFSKLSGPKRGSVFPQIIWSNKPRTLAALPGAALPGKDGDLCYTMRVYQFSHEDDLPPRMTGSTACTPANRVGLKAAIVSRPTAR